MQTTYSQFATDPEREKTGIWIEYGAAGRFLVARAGGANKNFEKRLETLARPYRRMIKADMMDGDEALKMMRQAYADAVVRDWDHVTGPDGAVIPFSPAAAVKLFEDLPDLFAAIMEDAQKLALYRAALLEEEAGN